MYSSRLMKPSLSLSISSIVSWNTTKPIHLNGTVKVLNFGLPKIIKVVFLEKESFALTMHLDGMVNSVDLNQISPGFAMFAEMYMSQYLEYYI